MALTFQSFGYTVELAKVIGIKAAVYLSALQYYDALNKHAESFVVSREDVNNLSGLSESEQQDAETILKCCNIIKVKPNKTGTKLTVTLFFNSALALLTQDIMTMELDTKIKEQLQSRVSKKTKKEAIADNLKKGIKIDDPDLNKMLGDWIDSVILSGKGSLTKKAIELSVQDLLSYSGDKTTLTEILRIAIKGGYRDLQWAIENYKKHPKDRNWKPYDSMTVQSSPTINEGF